MFLDFSCCSTQRVNIPWDSYHNGHSSKVSPQYPVQHPIILPPIPISSPLPPPCPISTIRVKQEGSSFYPPPLLPPLDECKWNWDHLFILANLHRILKAPSSCAKDGLFASKSMEKVCSRKVPWIPRRQPLWWLVSWYGRYSRSGKSVSGGSVVDSSAALYWGKERGFEWGGGCHFPGIIQTVNHSLRVW